MNTETKPGWPQGELTMVTHEDLAEVMQYLKDNLHYATPEEEYEFLMQEFDRLRVPMEIAQQAVMSVPNGPAAVLSLLLLAERQRDRLMIEQMVGDPQAIRDLS